MQSVYIQGTEILFKQSVEFYNFDSIIPSEHSAMEYFCKPRLLTVLTKIMRIKSYQMIYPVSYTVCDRSFHSISLSKDLKPFTPITNLVQNYAKKTQGKKGAKQKLMQLSDEEMSEAIDIQEYRTQLNEIQEKLKKDYVENISLRSSASNIDSLLVKLGDEEYPLHELAQISKKGQNLIAINMSDFPEALKPAIQAIIDSGSGMNPQQEGTMIYLSIPKLTREHRENLAKNAKTVFMRAKEEIRDVQNYFMKDAKRKTDLSEDLIFSVSNHIKLLADQTSAELEKILKIKQKELLGES
ncbi:ribosome-recycling factor, mitochondrial [Nephila pilipes]|uniref:Ribosome-recycling factor, mitochondrial n=1 Tax=Nephila pilipes TaxID=299642 RepID=A0A8X6M5K7_NEPPI|nr:ribosome-recycling factor, mitochondrial [Nephila pilipes]